MSLELETPSIRDQFEQIIQTEDKLEIREFLNKQKISDVADLVYELEGHAGTIIGSMSVHRAASVFKILDLSVQKDVIRELPPAQTAELLNELPDDDRTDFLEDLPKSVIRDLIKLLDPEERKITLSLLGYPPDSVGRLMTPDYVYIYENYTVEEVLATIRKHGKNSETIDVIYVINEKGELVDDIKIRDIILAKTETRVSEILDGRIVALNVNDDQEQASQVFKMNNRVALPVTDDNNILLGIVTIDDMLWVVNEEHSEDIQKMGGTEVLDEPYLDIPLLKLVKKRAGWLVVLFLSEMLTATAMQHFQGELEKALVLSLFIPLITSSGGNSGSQASSLIIQAMALGEVTVADWWRVMRREITSGLLLGVILGSIGYLRIFLWQNMHIFDYGAHWHLVAITIFFTLIGIVLWGSLMGSMLPIILKKCKLDPATSSAPFVATLVDVTGIVIYFSVAFIVLRGVLL